ncbi:hypothetical protein CEUSTIGMA_g3649.t1 [Chlamydomonas eustigma]|uniref:Spindle assembly abnormal protein 6 N-terminal domain-containing protein n=1 Tax=Chlamydomonas eustigma TaxID=1157962 RepID=A0A250WZJ6_9CHLO|nr:hypothetical protein CEUSTIGMA_g3649.t1 [Chlamydomonas eustigma]|eukprot:GAX76205.1 hypothetical protein CEUSTIGMA_g3649.t1 [Chlamydomonas eustigma]
MRTFLTQSSHHETQVGALEAIRVKILVKGEPGRLDSLKVELSSESNLFFHYAHEMDAKGFQAMQESQRLMVTFTDYPTVLLRMLNQCIKDPHIQLAVFVMQPNGEARMDFIQNMEYKFVELLSCRFMASPEDVVRQQVSYRYNVVKARLTLMQFLTCLLSSTYVPLMYRQGWRMLIHW